MKTPLLKLSLHSSLHHLLVIMPPEAVTYIGAGNGTGSLAQFFAQAGVADVTFVDAEERHLPHLKRNLEHCPGARVVHQLVAERTQPATYYRANIASESGLLDPSLLEHLWPNIKINDSEHRPGVSLADLLEDSHPRPTWLVVDCIPIVPILGDCSSLKDLDVIVVRVAQMEGEASLQASSGLAEANELLSAHGFIHVLTESGRHPGIGHALFVCSIRKTASQAKDAWHAYADVVAQLSADRRDAGSTRELLESRVVQLTQRVRELEGEQKATEEAAVPRQLIEHVTQVTTKADELKNIIEALEQRVASQLTVTNAAMERFLAECESEQASSVLLSMIRRLFEEQFEKQRALLMELGARQQGELSRLVQLTQRVGELEAAQKAMQEVELHPWIAERLGEGTAKAVEIKSSIDALERVMISQVTSIHAAMERLTSPDSNSNAGSGVARLIEEHFEKQKALFSEIEGRQKRDLSNAASNAIKQIEAFIGIQRWLPIDDSALDFHGWPISPDLGIFLLGKIQEGKYDLIIEFGSGTSTVLFARAFARARGAEIKESLEQLSQKRVISFEHDRLYYEKTLKLLKTRGLDEFVNLVHAPLVDHDDSSNTYLHYDCAPLLRQIAQFAEGRTLSILVLVDGPPELTCKNARYPAIPKIFDHLGRHRIDVVLDDANRPAEKETIRMWKEYWKARSVRIADRQIASEKGIYFASNMI
ncbi:hypothetical protein [Cupriavidus necator]|uniref:hypothetical protein n=1 Tax=Cupriavidus necator TaxID=106590 RepID=UPI00339D3E28